MPISDLPDRSILISITSLPRAYWSRRRYVRRPLAKSSSMVAILLWLVLLLNRVEIVSPLFQSTVELKRLILNKHNKWFHSSRVKVPFVKMPVSWFLVSTYLILIFSSKLIGSNNRSSATLWVLGTPSFSDHLDHCFISTNTNNKASLCEEWTFKRFAFCQW